MTNQNIPDKKQKENFETAKEFIGQWLIAHTAINEPANEAFQFFHRAYPAMPAENLTARMMVDYTKEKDLIIYGIEEGAGEWKSEASDWKHKFEIVANALTELVKLKEIKETEGETREYLDRKPKAWVTAKSLVTEIEKL